MSNETRDWEGERTEAFKRIDAEFCAARRRRKEKLRWYQQNPRPRTAAEIEAFALGFSDRMRGSGCFGRTWPEDQDANEAYDRGMNFAEEIFIP